MNRQNLDCVKLRADEEPLRIIYMGGGEIILFLTLIIILVSSRPKEWWEKLANRLTRNHFILLRSVGFILVTLSLLVLWAIVYLQR